MLGAQGRFGSGHIGPGCGDLSAAPRGELARGDLRTGLGEVRCRAVAGGAHRIELRPAGKAARCQCRGAIEIGLSFGQLRLRRGLGRARHGDFRSALAGLGKIALLRFCCGDLRFGAGGIGIGGFGVEREQNCSGLDRRPAFDRALGQPPGNRRGDVFGFRFDVAEPVRGRDRPGEIPQRAGRQGKHDEREQGPLNSVHVPGALFSKPLRIVSV